MEKYWDLNGDVPVLVKTSLIHKGQQGVNEAFATMLHRRQKSSIPYVQYSVERLNDEQTQSFCDEFTSDGRELINAYEIVESQKTSNSLSVYESYIEICSKNGIDREVIQQFIAKCYGVKLEMVKDFQCGKKISLYHEKHPAKYY